MRKILFISVAIILITRSISYGTHNRAGEITYRHISGYTYEVTVLTYTYTPSPANRDSLRVNWGDGTPLEMLYIDQKIFLPDNVRINTYVGVHTYNGPGTYTISMEDPNRNAGIVNIPNSVSIAFYIESQLVINPFLGANSSPVLLMPPIDHACVGHPFIHNPTAYDPDGDSLSFSLITCKQAGGVDIHNYTLPPAANSITIDPVTGELYWDYPTINGEFNVAILIEEWRNGVRIGYVIRDMQIFVTPCNNDPPVIEPLKDTCVMVGDTLTFTVTASDPNNDPVTLSASGGPLILPTSPATFPTVTHPANVTGLFRWIPDCNAVQKQPYLVTFKAVDNGIPVNMFDLKSMRITVIAPPPDTITANPVGNSMIVEWSQSPCSNASGYSLYRKEGPSGFIPQYCETGVPPWTGFQEIAKLSGLHNTIFIDDDNGNGLKNGMSYCYRIVANFPDGAQSKTSYEVCNHLVRDLPIITNISVTNTDNANGAIYVAWVPPLEIDSAAAPGPHKYLIYRSQNNASNYQLMDSLPSIMDTIFVDTALNTENHKWFYRIDLINDQPGNRFKIGSTEKASSIFLKTIPQDRQIDLSWEPVTPWVNLSYTIYRQDPITFLFDSIASTSSLSYSDKTLENDVMYCYYVKSTGTYSNASIFSPLINFSQITCEKPYDNVGPCATTLSVTTDCITNTVIWNMPPVKCGGDIAEYEVWFAPNPESDFFVIHHTNNPFDTIFHHTMEPPSAVGCYKIRGIDSTGNLGEFSKVFCIDDKECDRYKIPNVFTPNDDGHNDLLMPFPYSNVERIDLTIINRWGNEIYKTDNPDILWDGTNMNTGSKASQGVYFYVCDVYFYGLEEPRKRTISGIVHLMR